MNARSSTRNDETRAWVRVWDPLIRIGHWTLVLVFFTAYFTEDEWLAGHVWAGYVVGAVVLLRILWGFVGTRHARFGDFIRSPAAVARYLGNLFRGHPRRYLGHNPLGGVMILLMLILLLTITWSGLVVYALEDRAGPLAGVVYSEFTTPGPAAAGVPDEARDEEDEDEDYGREGRGNGSGESDEGGSGARFEEIEDYWEEVHELAANLMLLLIGLHIAGVVLSSWLHRENLVRAMIDGRKPVEAD
ncbi:MAG: cytochrome b/b6 domain-containing protein [Wenzhouxiangellaceae bacterium]|nr:cytochrome b/b6 domain-containing protein [Wenzhouxiangellaceae bacterium]